MRPGSWPRECLFQRRRRPDDFALHSLRRPDAQMPEPRADALKRRDLMKLAPVALAASAAPAFSTPELPQSFAEVATPVMQAYREYIAYKHLVNTTDFEGDGLSEATDRLEDYVERVVALPSQGPADTAIKFFTVSLDWEALHAPG